MKTLLYQRLITLILTGLGSRRINMKKRRNTKTLSLQTISEENDIRNPQGHEWQATPNNKSRGKGCPICAISCCLR